MNRDSLAHTKIVPASQIMFSSNSLFAVFGAQQGIKLGGPGIVNCQCV